MKNIFTIIILLAVCLPVLAQQEDQFTQFMYYKMGFNPAYAGSQDGACITAMDRHQWVGLDGAPESQLITFNMPLFNKRVGLGASVLRHTIGITQKYTAEVVYAYRIPVGRGMFSMGLQGSIRLLRNDFDMVQSTQPSELDEAIPVGVQSKYVPNFGAGVYYSSRNFYLGFSSPRILENNIDFADLDAVISREVLHLYAMGGVLFKISDKLDLQPQMLLKYVKSAPFDADVNLSFIYDNKITAGVSYRIGGSTDTSVGESLSLLLGFQAGDSFFIGGSYDYTLSDLRDYNDGTFELVLRYCIGGKSEGEEYINPRFF